MQDKEFVEEFKDLLYDTMAEGIYNRLGELIASNKNDKEKWITIKGNHILLKDGESIEEAFKRSTGVELSSKETEKEEKKTKEHTPSKLYTETLNRVKESNDINYTPEDIIKSAVKVLPYTEKEIKEKIAFAEKYNKEVREKGRETKKVYTNEKGEYTPERQEKHKQILEDLFKNAKAAKPKKGEKPTFMILGGRGGSGKSRFDMPSEKHPNNVGIYDKSKYIVLDADAIKEKLDEYKGYNAFEVHEESSDILTQAFEKAREEGLNVVWDGTMKTLKSVEKRLKPFEEDGYNIEMYYMHLPREKAAQRAIGRYLEDKKGRYVPLNVILDEMKQNEENFDELKSRASKWAFYNNDVKKGEKPILIDKNY